MTGEANRGAAGNLPASPQDRLPARERTAMPAFSWAPGKVCLALAGQNFFAGAGPAPAPFKHSLRVRISPCLFPFGFRRLPRHRRIVCALPRLGCLAGQVIAPAPTVSCNRLNSEDRAIPPKSLILQRRTIRNLLQVTGYVTGCISTVTTSVTLPAGPRALGRRNCDQYATPRHIAVRQYDGMRTERARQRVANLKQAPSQQKKAPILQPERSLDELGSTSRGR